MPAVPASNANGATGASPCSSFKPFRAPPKTYLITHLRREFGVTARTLRYYEERGLLSPLRSGGARIYSRRDRARLVLILRGRTAGIALGEIGQMLDLYDREGRAAQRALALRVFKRQIRLLELRRDEAERGIEILRTAIDQLIEGATCG